MVLTTHASHRRPVTVNTARCTQMTHTNQAIALLNGKVPVDELLAGSDETWLPVIVVGELCFGAERSGRRKENLAKVDALCGVCQIAIVTESVARAYAVIRLGLRERGTPISENDVWIAAICIANALVLATDDHHFDAVQDLQTRRMGT